MASASLVRTVGIAGIVMLIATCVHADKGKAKMLSIMKSKAASAPDHIIMMTPSEFDTYVLSAPRPYNIALVFNAQASRFQCAPCVEIGENLPLVSNALYEESAAANVPTFVVQLEFDYLDGGQVFKKLDISTAPIVLFVHAILGKQQINPKTFVSSIMSSDRFDITSKNLNAESIAKWISQRSGLSIVIVRPIDWRHLMVAFGFPTLVVFIFLAVVGPTLWAKRSNPYIYLVISFAIYTFCVSGGMFNILKNTPWAGQDENGNIAYIHGGNGWQLTSESYICGGLQVALGVAFLFMSTSAVQFESASHRNILSGATLLVCVLLFNQLRHLVTYKMPGYNNGWVYAWL